MALSQALKHNFVGLFHPVVSQTTNIGASAATTDQIISSGAIIDRYAYGQAFESAVGLVSCRINNASSQAFWLTGAFFHDTSSAGGGMAALGATATLTVVDSSVASSAYGVLKVPQDLSSANRYIQFRYTYEISTAAGSSGSICSVVLLTGADELPCS